MTPWASVDGDRVTIHGVRNLGYRTETDFVPNWEDRTYDLRKLDSADLIAVYWAGKPIAHIMLSFGFEGEDYLAISIETRKERGESYSTIAGFFKQYELRVHRGRRAGPDPGAHELPAAPGGRLHLPAADAARQYPPGLPRLHQDDERAARRPAFYNTLTTNCTTGALIHTRVNPGTPPLSWKEFC